MEPKTFIPRAARTAALLVACSTIAAAAAGAAPALPAGAFMNGGIGDEEQQSIEAYKGPYNLRLTFAQSRTGEYIAGLDVKIETLDRKISHGPYRDCGPLFFVRLDPGVYRVSATYEGVLHTKTVRVGGQAVEMVLYWP